MSAVAAEALTVEPAAAPPPAEPEPPPAEKPKGGVRPRYLTREEYHRAAAGGTFAPEEHLELLEGEVLQKVSPQGERHATALQLAMEALREAFGPGYSVRVQSPLSIPAAAAGERDSEPEPDLLVAQGTARTYLDHHPRPAEVLLVAEISDWTLDYDRGRKLAIYARAGIPEYWVLNLVQNRLEVYLEPGLLPGSADQHGYRSVALLGKEHQVTPLAAPPDPGTGVRPAIPVSDLLPVAGEATAEPEGQPGSGSESA